MRGQDTQRSTAFSYLSPEERVPAEHPLGRIRLMVDTVLKALSPAFDEMYWKIILLARANGNQTIEEAMRIERKLDDAVFELYRLSRRERRWVHELSERASSTF